MSKTVVFILLIASQAWGDAILDRQMADLQSKYRSLESFRANFTQSYLSRRFSENTVEKGVVYFQRGGLMRWEYQEPEKKIFISDGLFFFYYVPADKQVIKMPVEQSDQYPALFLAGKGNFLTDFHAQWADPRAGSHMVKLVPVKERPDFQHLIAEIDPVRNLIVRLLVVDVSDNRTEYRFNQIVENPSLPSNFFEFNPPPGTDLIFQTEKGE